MSITSPLPPAGTQIGGSDYGISKDSAGFGGDDLRELWSANQYDQEQLNTQARVQELSISGAYAQSNITMAEGNNTFGQQMALREADLRDRGMGLQEKTLGIQGSHVEKSDLHFETARDADNTLTAMMNDIRGDKSLSAEEKTEAIGKLYSTQRQGDAANMHYSNQTTLAGTSNNTATSQSSGMIGQNALGANGVLLGQGLQAEGIGMGTAGFTQGLGVGMMPPMPMAGMFSSPVDTTMGLLGGTGMPAAPTGAPSALSSVPSGNINKGG